MPVDTDSRPHKLRHDVDLQRADLPKLGSAIVKPTWHILLGTYNPMEFKFRKGYTHPSLANAKHQLYLAQRGCQES